MNRKTLLFLFSAALLVMLSSWLFEHGSQQLKQHQAASTTQPDYYMQDFSVTTMNEKGHPIRILKAERLEHYPGDDRNEMLEPRLTLLRDGQTSWRMQAAHAIGYPDQDVVQLQGGVQIQQADPQRPATLQTQTLKLHPERGFAHTADPVHITQGSSYIDGVGMELHHKEERVVLLSQVRGLYATSTR